MAESSTVRARRSRLHKRGDHSLCRSCSEVQRPAAAPASDVVERLRSMAAQSGRCNPCSLRLGLALQLVDGGPLTAAAFVAIRGALVEVEQCEHQVGGRGQSAVEEQAAVRRAAEQAAHDAKMASYQAYLADQERKRQEAAG